MAPDPYRYFRVEARELVDQLGQAVLDLERAPRADGIGLILRLAHTLKGAARVVKHTAIADLAHAAEDALTPYRDTTEPIPRARIDTMLRLLDDMSEHIAHMSQPERGPATPQAAEPQRAWGSDAGQVGVLLDSLSEAHAEVVGLRASLRGVGRARQIVDMLGRQMQAPRGAGTSSRDDELRHRARGVAEDLRGVLGGLETELGSGLDQVERELGTARETAEQLRLVPVRALFTALERTVRDTAPAARCMARFEGSGGDMRLDGQVLAEIQPALVQLVRNAIAHGVEPEPERVAAGKPAEGVVAITVRRRGRDVVFTCADDGRGVNIEAVRRAAQRQGHSLSETRRASTADLLQLLLRGGMTTSSEVTGISGRGIGLDVVRDAAQRLGGHVDVRSDPGRGTTVEIVVRWSVAAMDALVVEAAGTVVSIPLDRVRRAAHVAIDAIARTGQGWAILHEGATIPFAPLSHVMGHAASPRSKPWPVIVVQGADGMAAFGVDRLVGTAGIVFRPLPELAPAAPIVAGASLTAEGDPRLVLDVDALVVAATLGHLRGDEAPAVPRLPILVIDDSLTTRMLEQSILESAGFTVAVAASGEEALEMAAATRFALFLVDVEMPGMNGFTFIERTRADATLRDIPAILVTSRASADDRRRGIEVGARGHIVKSDFDQADLLDRIRKLVEAA